MLVSYIMTSTTALVMYYPHSGTNQKDKCWSVDSNAHLYCEIAIGTDPFICTLQSRNKQNFYLIQTAYYFWQGACTFLQKEKLESYIFAFELNLLQINLDSLTERSRVKRVNTEHPSLTDRRS